MGEGRGDVEGEDEDDEVGEEGEGDKVGDVGEGRRSGISMSVVVSVFWGSREVVGEGEREDVSAMVDSVVVVVVVSVAFLFWLILVGSTILNERGSSCGGCSLVVGVVVVGLSSVEMDEVPFSAARTSPLK